MASSGCQRDQSVNDPASNFIALVDQPATSPSGRYLLSVVARDMERPYELAFTITDTRGEFLYSSEKIFDNRSVTSFLWGDEDRVWVYSGDVGTYFWQQGDSEMDWQVATYARSEVPAPDYLKKIRPKYHPR